MIEKELIKYIGKILIKENSQYKWMMKLVNVKNYELILVTQGMDIFPEPRAYHKTIGMTHIESFNTIWEENFDNNSIRLPTKEELNLYRKYTRELRLLGTNKSMYGTK